MLLARRAPSLLLRSTGAPLRAVATAPTALSSAAAAAAAAASRPAASLFSAAVRGGAAASGSTTAASAATVASGTARALARRFMSSGARGLGAVGAPSQREMEFVTQGRQGGSKPRRNVSGVISINTKWNNTLIDISDTAFNTKATVTAGSCGFKKSKRASVFATEKTVSEAFVKARSLGIRKVMINLTGSAMILRKPLMQSLREQSNLRIMKLRLSTAMPHGGCRPRKARRRRIKTKAKRT